MGTIARPELDTTDAPRGRELTPDLDQVLGRYRVRFASGEQDLDRILRLRFEVFNLELGEGLEASFATQRDEDHFDAQCQHLLVLENASDTVVGTYRLQVAESAFAGCGFYSATEFDLSGIPDEVLAESVELGRACVAREHRSKSVLFLLWRGLASYVVWNRRRYFFGCSSLTSQSPALGMATYEYLRGRGQVHPSFEVRPLAGYECEAAPGASAGEEVEIPPLFGIYLRYGAKVCGPPAIDRFFGTIDFLTLLDVAQVDPRTFAGFAG